MREWLSSLDSLLRGKRSEKEILASGTDHLAVRKHLVSVIVLGAIYGLAMGLFAAVSREPATPEQLLSSAVKVPLLFLLSLAVTLPSFLVFSALLGVKLSPMEAVRVIVAAILVNVTVLASFAPITAFFTVCTTSYPFMKLLSIFFFIVAGAIGMGFFRRLVGNLEEVRMPPMEKEPGEEKRQDLEEGPQPPPTAPPEPPAPPPPAHPGARLFGPPPPMCPPPPLRRPTPDERLASRRLMGTWVVIYVLVAAQMAWVLRPLVGTAEEGFVWFKFDERGGSFLQDLFQALRDLLGG